MFVLFRMADTTDEDCDAYDRHLLLTKEQLECMTSKQLQVLLEERSLKKGGLKSALVNRLFTFMSGDR